MNKAYGHWEEGKARAMGLFWVTARQVVWRVRPHGALCRESSRENRARKEAKK